MQTQLYQPQSPLDSLKMVADKLSRLRLPLIDEKQTQEALEEYFKVEAWDVHREFRFNQHDIIDFLMPSGIGIEVKLKGQKKAIYRQVCRYAEDERVTAIILATAVSMDLPRFINNKPALVVSLTRGWI